MNVEEWRLATGRINDDIRGIVRAQRVLAEIDEELQRRAARPLEEDFVFTDAFGHNPREPRVVEVDGVQLRIRTLHRRGIRQTDIKGADLLYEIAGRKFVLVQYKAPDARGAVPRDADQLNDLISACPNPCPPPSQGLWPTCGAWFAATSAVERLYLPACVASTVFGDAQSRRIGRFSSGVSAEVFQQLFAKCWIGARTTPSEFAYLSWAAMEQDRVLFSVLQVGTFGG